MKTRIILCGACGKMGGNVLSLLADDSEATVVCGVDLFPKEIGIPVYQNFANIQEDVDVIIDFSSPKSLDGILEFIKGKNIGAVLCSTGYNEEDIAKIAARIRGAKAYFLQNFVDSGNLIGEGLSPVSDENMIRMRLRAQEVVPNAAIRGE